MRRFRQALAKSDEPSASETESRKAYDDYLQKLADLVKDYAARDQAARVIQDALRTALPTHSESSDKKYQKSLQELANEYAEKDGAARLIQFAVRKARNSDRDEAARVIQVAVRQALASRSSDENLDPFQTRLQKLADDYAAKNEAASLIQEAVRAALASGSSDVKFRYSLQKLAKEYAAKNQAARVIQGAVRASLFVNISALSLPTRMDLDLDLSFRSSLRLTLRMEPTANWHQSQVRSRFLNLPSRNDDADSSYSDEEGTPPRFPSEYFQSSDNSRT